MTKLKQTLFGNRNGDCFRTCMAMLLDKESPEEIINFAKDENFLYNFKQWLEENKLVYIEMTQQSFNTHSDYLPNGLCVLVGKSPRGNFDHAVIGEVFGEKHKSCVYVADPHPEETYLENVKFIGFLSKAL